MCSSGGAHSESNTSKDMKSRDKRRNRSSQSPKGDPQIRGDESISPQSSNTKKSKYSKHQLLSQILTRSKTTEHLIQDASGTKVDRPTRRARVKYRRPISPHSKNGRKVIRTNPKRALSTGLHKENSSLEVRQETESAGNKRKKYVSANGG
jgi:hypothetical protein